MIKFLKTKYNSLPTPIKATFWFTICNFIVKGISFISVPIFTRVLSTDEYGIVTIYNSFQQVLMIIATFELSLGAYNKGILKYKNRVEDYTTAILILGSFLTTVVFLVTILLKNIFIDLTNTNFLTLVLTFIMFLFFPAYNCWLCRKRFSYDYVPAICMTLGYALVTTLVPLLIVVFVSNTGNAKIQATLIAQIAFCISFFGKSIKLKKDNRKLYKEVVTYTVLYQLPLVFHALSFLVLGQADRVMIGKMVGTSEAAIYSVAYSVSQAIILFQTSLNQVFQPYRFKKMESGSFEDIRETSNIMVLIIAIITMGFTILSPEIMNFLFTNDYRQAIELMPPIITSVFFIFLYNIFSDVEAYYNKTSYIMYASFFAAGMNVVLNYFGIKKFGYSASAYTTLICYILLAVAHYLFVVKICKRNKILVPIYDYKFVMFVSIVLIVYMSTLLYVIEHELILVRFFLLLLLCLVVFVKRKRIIEFLKKGNKR